MFKLGLGSKAGREDMGAAIGSTSSSSETKLINPWLVGLLLVVKISFLIAAGVEINFLVFLGRVVFNRWKYHVAIDEKLAGKQLSPA